MATKLPYYVLYTPDDPAAAPEDAGVYGPYHNIKEADDKAGEFAQLLGVDELPWGEVKIIDKDFGTIRVLTESRA